MSAEVDESRQDARAGLPAIHAVVDEVRRHPGAIDDQRVAKVARTVLRSVRATVRHGDRVPSLADIAQRVRHEIGHAPASSLAKVINATGVIVHTNLGRAPLSRRAIDAAVEAAGYVPLEIDPGTGRRGARTAGLTTLLAEVCQSQDAIVVNNAAGALMLALAALASPGAVAVGRGELVEIGGGFRLPDVMRASGCSLREVGTTNRTYVRDYEEVAGEIDLVLRVHPSNYHIVGFTSSPSGRELADVAARLGVPFVHDVGSGVLGHEVEHEVEVRSALAAGADVVLFSGDKLLGGPQAGCLVGDRTMIERCRQQPLYRALRINKLCAAALEATLATYAEGRAHADLPVWQLAGQSHADLDRRARHLAAQFQDAEIEQGAGRLGGGSAPMLDLPGPIVTLGHHDGADALAQRLRAGRPAVHIRVNRGRVVVDLRSVPAEDDLELARAIGAALESSVD